MPVTLEGSRVTKARRVYIQFRLDAFRAVIVAKGVICTIAWY